jgi:hypothetical protein
MKFGELIFFKQCVATSIKKLQYLNIYIYIYIYIYITCGAKYFYVNSAFHSDMIIKTRRLMLMLLPYLTHLGWYLIATKMVVNFCYSNRNGSAPQLAVTVNQIKRINDAPTHLTCQVMWWEKG